MEKPPIESEKEQPTEDVSMLNEKDVVIEAGDPGSPEKKEEGGGMADYLVRSFHSPPHLAPSDGHRNSGRMPNPSTGYFTQSDSWLRSERALPYLS